LTDVISSKIMKYLKDNEGNEKTWSQVTRDERYFCAELFFEIRANPEPFLKLIGRSGKSYDFGYEACFYRDFLKNKDLSARKEKFPFKRTFDMLLLSENEIIIIEAKAFMGFDNKQLPYFTKDRELIPDMFKLVKSEAPKVSILAIHSSKYSPAESTRKYFDKLIMWKDIADEYGSKNEILQRADDIYE
jgi:hypothetical protein